MTAWDGLALLLAYVLGMITTLIVDHAGTHPADGRQSHGGLASSRHHRTASSRPRVETARATTANRSARNESASQHGRHHRGDPVTEPLGHVALVRPYLDDRRRAATTSDVRTPRQKAHHGYQRHA
jgi:hypothetical protein